MQDVREILNTAHVCLENAARKLRVPRLVPRSIRESPAYRRLREAHNLRNLRRALLCADPLNVVLGAGGTEFVGWFSTDIWTLDITSPSDWERLFRPASIDRLLAEHVLEHLTETEVSAALHNCRRYLKPGGLLRIAVPDGYRDDEGYLAKVRPPRDGHRLLFTVDTLVALVETTGLQATPLEYFDSCGHFHRTPWSPSDGYVARSAPFDRNERYRRGDLFYTSLIVDARRPWVEASVVGRG